MQINTGVTAGFLAMGGSQSVNCVLIRSFNLFLFAVATAIGGLDARANDVQDMMRGAEQTFKKTFAEGFTGKAWRRSRIVQGRIGLAKPAGEVLAGAASAAPIEQSVAPGAANISTASPAPSPLDQTREAAIDKPQAKERRVTVVAPASPEKAVFRETPGQRMAKAEPVAPPLPDASIVSAAGFRFKDCEFCPPLVVVPNGEFTMGANERPHERPAHKVRIPSPFAIGQYEVTYEEWDRCVHAGACRYRPVFNGSRHEAIGNLSWDDANAYLKWISEKTGQVYRLPSEAEWEYAARAGSGKASCSTCASPDNEQTAAPGSHKPNPFGLYDTAGNMAEWVQDCWNESYQGAPADGSPWTKGNCSLRGLRGGSFGNNTRFRYDSDVRYDANGFRVLRELR
jgi:formylglycine-generating enzyme required for sulfatase activity